MSDSFCIMPFIHLETRSDSFVSRCCMSQDFYKKEDGTLFTLSKDTLDDVWNSSEIKNDFEGRIVHAVQPNLSLGEIGDIEFKLPPSEELASRMQIIEGILDKKNINTAQIRTLTELRDTLLPKLMRGEVKVEL